jgi:APA family basic amino acid/polyamine antiporter
MTEDSLRRGLGLGSTVAIIVGYVIGASIFVLIGPLAFKTGPGLWVTYLLASIPALFMCFTSSQLGSALPVTGANYVVVSRTMGPFWGYMTVWAMMITTLIGVPLVAYGFADYLSFFVEGLPPMPTAIVITLIFGAINILGVKVMGWVQNIMVLIFMAAIVVFGLGGLMNIDPVNITPLNPNGWGAIVMAAIPAYFSFVGFMVITEMGGEIKNPARNIPRAILVGFIVVLVAYFLVTFSLTGILDWKSLENTNAAVAEASKMFLPGWVTLLIEIGALVAAFTTINAIIATGSRDIYAMAKDRVFPSWLAAASPTLKTPYAAIGVITLLAIIGILLGAEIVQYAFITVMGVMAIHLKVALAVIRMKKRLPDHYEKAPFKLKGFWRVFWPAGVIVIAVIYILLGFAEAPVSVGVFFIAYLLGGLLFVERRWRLKRHGIDMAKIFEKDVDDVVASASSGE